MQAHRIALFDERFIDEREHSVRRAVWLSKKQKRVATPVRDAADARSSRTKAR
jgi:hypothetical protein